MASGGGRPPTIGDSKEVVHELVQHLYLHLHDWTLKKRLLPIVPDKVVKAGSLGHGTAVPGDFDLDLVIYSQSIDPNDVKQNGYDRWLGQLKLFLEETLDEDDIEDISRTVHSVQFTYKEWIEVDLLVSPKWDYPADLYNFLGTVPKHRRFRFSVNASLWQVEFFQDEVQVPPQAKELIKKAKAWRNRVWPKESHCRGKPKSYVLSLLVLYAYRIAFAQLSKRGRENGIEERTTRVLRNMVEGRMMVDNSQLKRTRRLNVCWEKFYRRRDYPRLLPSRPRIIDPANPTNNLYETGITHSRGHMAHDYQQGDGDWRRFKEMIHTLDLTKKIEEILLMDLRMYM